MDKYVQMVKDIRKKFEEDPKFQKMCEEAVEDI